MVFSFDDMENTYEESAEVIDFFANEEYEQLHLKLDNALQKLPKDEYALILFFYYQQKTMDEIAFVTEQTAANVKVKLFRIRKKSIFQISYSPH